MNNKYDPLHNWQGFEPNFPPKPNPSVYDMQIGDKVICESDSRLSIMKVPGGWIYYHDQAMVFVPMPANYMTKNEMEK